MQRNLNTEDNSGTQSVRRAALVLKELATRMRTGSRLVDISAATGLEPPTARRILRGLMSEGMVIQDALTRRYSLGDVIYELGLAVLPRTAFRDLCRPSLVRIATWCGDTVFLNVRSGLDAVCVDRREGSYPVRTLTIDIGERRPLGVGSGPKAILFAQPELQMKEILLANAQRFSAYDGVTRASVLRAAERFGKLGYVCSTVTGIPGVKGLGVPISLRDGRCFAALSVAAIDARMAPARQTELASLLRAEARGIAREHSRM